MPCNCAAECNGLGGEECRRCCIIYADAEKGVGGLRAMRAEIASWPVNPHILDALTGIDATVAALKAMDKK